MNSMDLIESFNDSFYSDSLSEIITDSGDAIIDLVSDNEIIDSIPILGLLNGVYKTYKSISTARLIKKVAKFLFSMSNINAGDKRQFLVELSLEIEDRGSEFLLDIIDRIDNINKIDILSNLIRSKINGNLTVSDFVLLCKIVENIPYCIIRKLPSYTKEQYIPKDTDVLSGLGLLYLSHINPEGSKYSLNHIGYLLLKYGLCINVEIPSTFPVENYAYAVLR